MNVNEMIVRSADAHLQTQRNDGSFIPGHNGPYYDEELPLRNTAHLLILMLKAFDVLGDVKYRKSAIKALTYVTDKERRPMGATYWMRKKPEKDFSNGLVGQAWIMEALIYAGNKLDDDVLLEEAKQVFLLHPFDKVLARWRIVNVDGSYANVDMTFNHQLWFAAVGSFIHGDKTISEQVNHFLDNLNSNLKIYGNGLIMHELGGLRNQTMTLKRRIKQIIKAKAIERGKIVYKDIKINKAIGYHAFNTYAFSLIFNNRPDHPFWSGETFSKILNFIQTGLYHEGLEHCAHDGVHETVLPVNRFGYPYNPPGIEVAFTVQTFSKYFEGNKEDLIAMWLGRQLNKTFDQPSGVMCKYTDDKTTLAARMYEAVRLDNWSIDV